MLTADLLRARVVKGVVKPTYLRGKNANAQTYAAQLCDLYGRAQGWSRAQLQEALEEIVGDATDFLLARGLAKLLDDRCTWATRAVVPPQELRAALYDAAFQTREGTGTPHRTLRRPRSEVIAEVAAGLSVTEEDLEISMFADHREDERLMEYKAITPDDLLTRYDLSLAQAVLLRAQSVRITVQKSTAQQLRQLISALKFRQLLFRIERQPSTSKKKGLSDWILEIDGPLSILQRGTRYGLQLAMLIPVLVHLEKWSLEAQVQWPKHKDLLGFELDHRTGLTPVSRLRGAWISEEQKLLEERISEHKTPWVLERSPHLIPLGTRDLFAPEIVLKHPDGRVAYIEIIGTWRRHWLRTRLNLLKQHGPPNTVLCVSRNLAADREDLAEFEGEIVEFAQIISLPKVLKAADSVGRKP